jgi:zinc protease
VTRIIPSPRLAALALPLALALAHAGAAAAQQDRILVRAEPGTPVVAEEILLATGPADEPDLQHGIAYLTARAVTASLRPVLDSLGAHLEVQARKDAVAFSLTSAPEVWQDATHALLVAIFRDPADSAATTAQRDSVRAELQSREQSPADALERETDAAVFGADHPWGRPSVGTASAVAELAPADVDVFLRKNFTPDRVTVALVGDVDAAAAHAFLTSQIDAAPLAATEVPAPQPATEPVRKEYNSITAFVSATYPFPPGADVEALRMLASLAVQRISFGPSRRSVYNARAEIVRHAGGGELRFEVVVPPGESDRWVELLKGSVAAFADAPLPAAVFADRLRRWRGERLLELDTPEARARELAHELMLTGIKSTALTGADALTAVRLYEAAHSLPAPVLVYLGPTVNAAP